MVAAFIFGVFGLIVGSFLNVVILRRGVRSVGGRSGCMSCGAQLKWYDMIPVFSWVLLGGRCRSCRAHISIQYPLVELSTGLLFALIGASVGATLPLSTREIVNLVFVLTSLPIGALLIAIFVYDLKHTIIPDSWVYTFIALAFGHQFLTPLWGEYGNWLFLSGPIVAFPIFALWGASAVRYGEPGMWMGFGDVKLALGIGWLLGPLPGLLAVFLAFVIGACVSLLLVFFSSQGWKKFVDGFTPTPISQRLVWGFTMKSEIPFGPFLVLSCILIWFASLYGIDIFHVFGLSLWSSSSW